MPPADDQPLPPPKDPSGPYRICFVCSGNICRSPMADVVLRAKAAEAGLGDRVIVDSAGTGAWHVGERMDQGARRQLDRNGYDGDAHRARQFDRSWLAERDLVLAMDSGHLRHLRALANGDDDGRIRLFGEVGGLRGADVPDPYYGGEAEFAGVLAMLETGLTHLIGRLKEVPGLAP
jgi:protein-tyrosine phosphatase